MWVVMATLWAGPAKILGRKELWGEQRLLSGAIPHPLLDTLQVKEAATLDTAPHLEERRERGKRERKWRWKEREGDVGRKGQREGDGVRQKEKEER